MKPQCMIAMGNFNKRTKIRKRKGYVAWFFIGVLVIFTIVLLAVPEKETFDPDKHVCLNAEMDCIKRAYINCNDIIIEIIPDPNPWVCYNWSHLERDMINNPHCKVMEDITKVTIIPPCEEWRDKNICELEPEAEHPECICLEWDIEEYYNETHWGAEGIEWIDEEKGVYRRIKWSYCKYDWGSRNKNCGGGLGYNENNATCLKARLRNICDDDPNHEDCECDEWENISYTDYRLWIDWFHGIEEDCLIKIARNFCESKGMGLRDKYSVVSGEGIFWCFDKKERVGGDIRYFTNKEIFDCYWNATIEANRISNITKQTCIKAHLKEGK